jgi:hypothetical protein
MKTLIENARSTFLISLPAIVACLVACGPREAPIRIIGSLSSNDLAQIQQTVCEEMVERSGSANGRPIKSIQVTTNNLYEMDRQFLPVLAALATTNHSAKVRFHEIEKRVHASAGQSNPAVNVWYADSNARWGEAGYTLEKGSNGWKVISILGR